MKVKELLEILKDIDVDGEMNIYICKNNDIQVENGELYEIEEVSNSEWVDDIKKTGGTDFVIFY